MRARICRSTCIKTYILSMHVSHTHHNSSLYRLTFRAQARRLILFFYTGTYRKSTESSTDQLII